MILLTGILAVLALVVGAVMSAGPSLLQTLLVSIGNLTTPVKAGVSAIFVVIFVVYVLYLKGHTNGVHENAEERSGSGRTVGTIIVMAAVIWLAMFVFSDNAARAGAEFANWRVEKAEKLAVARIVGYCSMSFSVGAFIGLMSARHTQRGGKRKTKKKGEHIASPTRSESESEEFEENEKDKPMLPETR